MRYHFCMIIISALCSSCYSQYCNSQLIAFNKNWALKTIESIKKQDNFEKKNRLNAYYNFLGTNQKLAIFSQESARYKFVKVISDKKMINAKPIVIIETIRNGEYLEFINFIIYQSDNGVQYKSDKYIYTNDRWILSKCDSMASFIIKDEFRDKLYSEVDNGKNQNDIIVSVITCKEILTKYVIVGKLNNESIINKLLE